MQTGQDGGHPSAESHAEAPPDLAACRVQKQTAHAAGTAYAANKLPAGTRQWLWQHLAKHVVNVVDDNGRQVRKEGARFCCREHVHEVHDVPRVLSLRM